MNNKVFRYEGFAADSERGLLTCRYSLDGREFAERVSLAPGPAWDSAAAQAAATEAAAAVSEAPAAKAATAHG